ncbi:response regulator [Clostridium sp. LY3-2]|uniref:response regulator n=1 Tax=Clostridium sp. LY3-2 TaxID=2942482 RepID=UPI002152B781|nr:response regulator [Clostridium sp. LY3-2]MCR6514140.1 response regulator [Clostridium sp. LY3-2]
MRKVVIVEDDPMVALINRKYVEMVEGFTVCSVVTTKDELIEKLEKEDISLILLDVYLPKENGFEILKDIREKGFLTDVIMMTAADNNEEIKRAFAYGAIDYLIKPFEFDRFKIALEKYNTKNELLKSSKKLNQAKVDSLYNTKKKLDRDLPKGINKKTLLRIYDLIKEDSREIWTIKNLSEELGISNVTIKKYIDYLESIGEVKVDIDYGNIGRPEYKLIFSKN